jgi:azurin
MKKIHLLPLLLMFGCGEGASDQQGAPQPAETESALHQSKDMLFHVSALGNTMDDIAFSPNEYSVPANTLIRVRLVNESSSADFNHNIVFIVKGTAAEIAREAMDAGPDANYIPKNPNILAASKLVAPGKITEFSFTTPAAGSYEYICTYPGHYPKMVGRLNVVDIIP